MFVLSSKVLKDGDFLLGFLFRRMFNALGPLKSCLLLFILAIILCFVAGYFDGTLYNIENVFGQSPGLVGMLKDYTLYTLWIVIFTVIYLLYRFLKIAQNFLLIDIPKILNEKVLSKENIKLLDNKFARIFKAEGIFKFLKAILFLIFFLFWLQNLIKSFDPVSQYGKDIWHSGHHIFGFIVLKFFNLIYVVYFLGTFFYYFIGTLAGFSWLFKKISDKNGFNIKPWSPDNSAGLKILSTISIQFMYMLLPIFLVFISFIMRGTNLTVGQQLSFAALILILFVTFFLPLGSVHSSMKRAKKLELEMIAVHFAAINDSVKKRLSLKDYGPDLVADIESLEKIDFVYAKTEHMPVWPFSLQNLWHIFLTALVPIIVFIIQLFGNPDSIIYKWDKVITFFRFLQ